MDKIKKQDKEIIEKFAKEAKRLHTDEKGDKKAGDLVANIERVPQGENTELVITLKSGIIKRRLLKVS